MFEAYFPYTGEWFVGDSVDQINNKVSKVYNNYICVTENDEGSLIIDYDVEKLANECDFITCIIAARSLINSSLWNGNLDKFQLTLLDYEYKDNILVDIAQSPYWDGNMDYLPFIPPKHTREYNALVTSQYWNGVISIQLGNMCDEFNDYISLDLVDNDRWNGTVSGSKFDNANYNLNLLIDKVVTHQKWDGDELAIYRIAYVDNKLEEKMKRHPNYKSMAKGPRE